MQLIAIVGLIAINCQFYQLFSNYRLSLMGRPKKKGVFLAPKIPDFRRLKKGASMGENDIFDRRKLQLIANLLSQLLTISRQLFGQLIAINL